MRYRDPPERTHHPTPGINRVCRRDPPAKSRRDPASSAARVANEDGDGNGGCGASSLTAVQLVFRNVSPPLLLLARRERGSAEGKNRGRGLTVMCGVDVDPPFEGGGAVAAAAAAEGNGVVVDVAVGLGRVVAPGG